MSIKLNRSLLRLAFGTFKERKYAWLFSILCAVVLPFLDIAITGSIYLLFTEDKRAKVILFLDKYLQSLKITFLQETLNQQIFVVAVGVILVLFTLALKYRNKLVIGELREFFAVADAQRLISNFLATSTMRARQVSKERVTSSILHDCGSRENYARNLVELGSAGIGLVLYGIGAIAVSWKIVGVVVVIYLTPFLITRRIYSTVEKLSRKQIRLREQVIHQVREVGDSIERARTDGLEKHLGDQTLNTVVRQKRKNLDMVRTKAKFSTIFDGFGQVQLLLVVFGSTAILQQQILALLILLIVFAKLQGYFGRITGGLQSINMASTKVDRFNSLMSLVETPDSMRYFGRAVADAPPLREIKLHNVSFGYLEGSPILKNFSMELKAGDKLLLSGASGIGKSTLLEIIGGLLVPDQGEVEFNQEVLSGELFQKLRGQICFVTPNVYIFDNSVRYNLSPAHVVGEDELWSALEKVGLHDFVGRKPQGLDMPVGPNGSELSTGQRQRLVLARAFIQKPTVLILDEFTANLDLVTETHIINVVNELISPESITVMAAHKLPSGFSPTRVLDLEEKGAAAFDRRSDH